MNGTVYEDLRVVTLSYRWSQHSGPLAAAGHGGKRKVVFDELGNAISILDPGSRSIRVASSSFQTRLVDSL